MASNLAFASVQLRSGNPVRREVYQIYIGRDLRRALSANSPNNTVGRPTE